ncbi:MAG: hypothetical protein HQL29_02725 [Candidatus Omnitrophica bacterium]|nr:hypothetical protein [Candidatus Omnitrophota bacterium]
MKLTKKNIMFILAVLFFAVNAVSDQAWCSAGKAGTPSGGRISTDPIVILDARLNTYSLQTVKGEVIVRSEDLRTGKIIITGIFSHLDNIGKILFSEDGGMTFKEMPVQENLQYEITPLPGKRYDPIVQFIDDSGSRQEIKVFQDVEAIVYSDVDYKEMIIEAIRGVSLAYERQSVNDFSRLVSREYLGNKVFLDEGVRFDFDMFTDIRLVIYVERIVREKDLFSAETKWDKKQIPRSTGQQQMTSGRTTFVFKIEDGAMKIYNLRGNLIYATLSPEIAEASGLSSAVVEAVREARNDRDQTQPGAGETEDAGGAGAVSTLTVKEGSFIDGEEYDLSSNQVVMANGDFSNDVGELDPNGNPGWILSSNFNGITEASSEGYNLNVTVGLVAGQVYIYKTTSGEFAKIEILNKVGNEISFKYAVQTDGTRNLRT